MANLNELPVLPKLLCTIGNLPASYVMSLSYEEQVLKLYDYLDKELVPATKELQALYGALQDYVNSYFDNLDVQTEINNKLDEMVEDGTLDTIINEQIFSELNTQVQTNTENIQTNSENIQTNTENIQTNTENIQNITNLSNLNFDTINFENTIIIGDSYSTGYYGDSTNIIKSWSEYLIELLGIQNYYKFDENGAGFTKIGDFGHTFQTLLSSNLENIEDLNKITHIIVCGGYNDRDYSKSTISNDITAFINYCKNNFPNAKIHIGMISNTSENNSTGTTNRYNLINTVLEAYKFIPALYLNGVENILRNYNFFTDIVDTTHPNLQGQKALGYGIYKALVTGNVDVVYDFTNNSMSIENSNIGDGQNYQCINIFKKNDIAFLYFPITTFVFTNTVDMDVNYDIDLGLITHSMFRPCVTGINAWNATFTVGYMENSELKYTFCNGFIRFDNNGHLIFRLLPTGENNSLIRISNIKNVRFTNNTITTLTLLS